MAPTVRTIFEFLTQENPKVEIRESKSKSRTSNPNYPIPRDVCHSEWFDVGVVRTIFDEKLGNVLKENAEGLGGWPPGLEDPQAVFAEDCLRDVAAAYIIRTVRLALQHEKTKDLLEQSIKIVAGGGAAMFFLEGTKFKSDWAGTSDIHPSCEGTGKPYTILPGDAKPSWVCSSTLVQEFIAQDEEEEGDEDEGVESEAPQKFQELWPFRQLLHYCLGSFARYGYILTDRELLIVRIRPVDLWETEIEDDQVCQDWFQDNAVMEYFAVSWDTHGSTDGLTICLALWVLHMLAANNGRLSRMPHESVLDEKVVPREKQRIFPSKADSVAVSAATDTDPSSEELDDAASETTGAAQEDQVDDPIYGSFADSQFNPSFESQTSGLGSKRKRVGEERVDEKWASVPAPDGPVTRNRLRAKPHQSNSHRSNVADAHGSFGSFSKRPRR